MVSFHSRTLVGKKDEQDKSLDVFSMSHCGGAWRICVYWKTFLFHIRQHVDTLKSNTVHIRNVYAFNRSIYPSTVYLGLSFKGHIIPAAIGTNSLNITTIWGIVNLQLKYCLSIYRTVHKRVVNYCNLDLALANYGYLNLLATQVNSC